MHTVTEADISLHLEKSVFIPVDSEQVDPVKIATVLRMQSDDIARWTIKGKDFQTRIADLLAAQPPQ